MGRLYRLRRSISITYGISLLYDVIYYDYVNSIIPPPIISLKGGIIWGSKRFY